MGPVRRAAMTAEVEIRAARSMEEVDAAYDLAARVFWTRPEEARHALGRARALDPLADLTDAVVAVSAGRVVGFVRLLERSLHVPSGQIRASGVTSVCVDADFRGRGIGLGIMEASLRRSAARGDACAVLFARRAVDGWYPRLGFVGLGAHPRLEARLGSVDRAGEYHFEPGFREELSQLCSEAYDDSYRGVYLSFRRGAHWWRTGARRVEAASPASTFFIVRRNGMPIGYVVRSANVVVECAAPLQERMALVDAMIAQAQRAGEPTLVAALPAAHWATTALRAFDHTEAVRYSWDGGHMVRIVDAAAFLGPIAGAATASGPATISHDEATRLARLVAGASGLTRDADQRPPLWPNAPTWSPLDEL